MWYLFIFAVIALIAPVVFLNTGKIRSKASAKRVLIYGISFFFTVIAVITVVSFAGAPAAAAEAAAETASSPYTGIAAGLAFLSAAIVTTGSCIGSGIAVSASATAALGAISENEGLFGKSLIFVALSEAISLYGVLISVLILNKI